MCAINLEMCEIVCAIILELSKLMCAIILEMVHIKCAINLELWEIMCAIILVMVEIICAIKFEIGEIMCAIDLEMNEIMCAINFEMGEIIFHHHHVNVQSEHLNRRIRNISRLNLNEFLHQRHEHQSKFERCFTCIGQRFFRFVKEFESIRELMPRNVTQFYCLSKYQNLRFIDLNFSKVEI